MPKLKLFGVKCLFHWTKYDGKNLGIEEIIFLVKAANDRDAFKKAQARARKQESTAKKKGDWNIKFIKENMATYEMYDKISDDCIEVYSRIFTKRRSTSNALRDLM